MEVTWLLKRFFAFSFNFHAKARANERRNMHWFFVLAKSLGELTILTLATYCLYYVVYWLNEFVNMSLPKRHNITIVKQVESMCDQCKKKGGEVKRLFKVCNHTFCSRCFLGRCTHLCQCVACRSVHFECYLCSRRRV